MCRTPGSNKVDRYTITLTLTLKNVNLVYNVEDLFRSLILISEDSSGGELYHNHKL